MSGDIRTQVRGLTLAKYEAARRALAEAHRIDAAFERSILIYGLDEVTDTRAGFGCRAFFYSKTGPGDMALPKKDHEFVLRSMALT
jgi:hypothetical protein